MTDSSPCVSIITATYNRSNVLRYTIASVLRSTFDDWEMLVVGDACTDDTAEVVASFDDSRVRFINLAANTGEQSGPNNEGLRQASGRYMAFLNHDDLWTPDHLEVCVRGIEETGADLVFTLAIAFLHGGRPGLRGGSRGRRYEPQALIPASQWLFRRELVEAVGPWRFSRDCYATPSQEWLFRAWRAGKELRLLPKVTVLAVPSGIRRGSYSRREHLENHEYFDRLTNDPTFVEQQLTRIAVDFSSQLNDLALLPNVRRIARNLLYRIGLRFNQAPDGIRNLIRFHRKGALVAHLREVRGLQKRINRGKEHG
jgi:glycosyltransferase involved in cell wall biosynthesis